MVVARVSRSISAAKLARSDPYVVSSPPPFKRTSTITRRTFGFRTSRPSDPTNPSVGRWTELKPKYTARPPASLRAHIGLALPERYSGFDALGRTDG